MLTGKIVKVLKEKSVVIETEDGIKHPYVVEKQEDAKVGEQITFDETKKFMIKMEND